MINPEKIKEMRMYIQAQTLKDIQTIEIKLGLMEKFGEEAVFITNELIEKISTETIAEARRWEQQKSDEQRTDKINKLADSLETMFDSFEKLPEILAKKFNDRLEQFIGRID